MHLQDQIAAALASDGWDRDADNYRWTKTMPTGGNFGSAKVTIAIDGGRWFERQDGWGKIERDVDLRNFPDAPRSAIAAVLS